MGPVVLMNNDYSNHGVARVKFCPGVEAVLGGRLASRVGAAPLKHGILK